MKTLKLRMDIFTQTITTAQMSIHLSVNYLLHPISSSSKVFEMR